MSLRQTNGRIDVTLEVLVLLLIFLQSCLGSSVFKIKLFGKCFSHPFIQKLLLRYSFHSPSFVRPRHSALRNGVSPGQAQQTQAKSPELQLPETCGFEFTNKSDRRKGRHHIIQENFNSSVKFSLKPPYLDADCHSLESSHYSF